MRILHLATRSHRRGAELVALELADELDALGHENRVVAMALAHDGSRDPDLPALVNRSGLHLDTFLASCWRVRRLARREPADVVIAHGGWATQVASLALRDRTTLVVWQRILGLPPETWGPLRQRWWREIASRVDVGLALTSDLEAELRCLGFLGPVWVIPNARQPKRFADLDREVEARRLREEIGVGPDVALVGLVGHLIEQKRPERAVDVLARLREQGRAVHLVLAGDGPLRSTLEEEIGRRGLSDDATMLGYRSDVEHVLGGLDVLVLTSEAEGIPGIAIEAQMAGCPIVSYPVGGVDEVIEDGVTGVILAEPDTALMAGEVAALLDDEDRRLRLAEEGRLRSSEFSAARTAVMYADHLGACHEALLASEDPAPRRGKRRLRWPGGDPRTPNLFLIGAPKAGTTYMHQALRLGHDVYMSAVKEPGFFTNDREYRKGTEYYLDAFFPHAERFAIRGESTPWYLYSDVARRRIASFTKDQSPKFLAFVRDPTERAVSMHADQRRIGREHRSFEEAIEEELADLERGRLVPDIRQRYVWCGHYTEHLLAWSDTFGEDNVCVLTFEELTTDPARLWRVVAEFLRHDLGEPTFAALSERDRNPGGELRWPRVDAFIRSLEGGSNPMIERAKAVLPPGLHRRFFQQFGRYNRTPAPSPPTRPDEATLAALHVYFADEARRLEKLLDARPPWPSSEVS